MKPVDPRLLRYATASRGFFAVTAAIVLAQTGTIIGFAWALTSALVGVIRGRPVGELWGFVGVAASSSCSAGSSGRPRSACRPGGRPRRRCSCGRP